jgi:hypothetical protein
MLHRAFNGDCNHVYVDQEGAMNRAPTVDLVRD